MKKTASKRPASCNVFAPDPAPGRLWRFTAGRDGYSLAEAWPAKAGQAWPAGAVSRDWRSLTHPRQNIAWMPPEKAFVRVIDLPASDAAEAASMIELQLERLSPLPPSQVVWAVEPLAQPAAPASTTAPRLTALLLMTARSAAEEHLARLDAVGYPADQLDVALAREFAETGPGPDGVWIWLEEAPAGWTALAAWRAGGWWREASLLRLGEGEAGERQLLRHLEGVAWGAELDGWFEGAPSVRLAAPPAAVVAWQDQLAAWSGAPVNVAPRQSPEALASAAARRWAGGGRSLAPEEVVRKRRAAFVDILWFQGVGAAFATYLAGVMLYFAALHWQEGRLEDARADAASLGRAYTNSLHLKAQVAVLEDQVALRYAALDAWRAAVERLPETITLSQLDFDKGRTLKLLGTVPAENMADVTKFNGELAKAEINGQPLFSKVKEAQVTARPDGSSTWNFEAELKRSGTP